MVDLTDMSLVDEDTNSNLAYDANRAIQGNLEMQTQGCDLEVGKIMYPKITTLISKKLKIMYIFQKIMY